MILYSTFNLAHVLGCADTSRGGYFLRGSVGDRILGVGCGKRGEGYMGNFSAA
jgi:hypothetical protein